MRPPCQRGSESIIPTHHARAIKRLLEPFDLNDASMPLSDRLRVEEPVELPVHQDLLAGSKDDRRGQTHGRTCPAVVNEILGDSSTYRVVCTHLKTPLRIGHPSCSWGDLR